MSFGDWILITLIIVAVIAAVIVIVKDGKYGKTCCGDCISCKNGLRCQNKK